MAYFLKEKEAILPPFLYYFNEDSFPFLIVCLTSGYQIEKHYTIIHYLHMVAEESPPLM